MINNVVKPAVKSALMMAGTSSGALMGGTAGASMGGPSGALIGKQAGSAMGGMVAAKISKLIGSGDYATTDTRCNSLMCGQPKPYDSFGSNGGVRITHREYLADVFTSNVSNQFSITAYSINPGLSQFAPFLANLAQNFEEYHLNGLIFEFISTTSPYTTGNSLGSVITAMEYNAAALPFNNKQQMENSDFSISTRFDKNIMYGVECKDPAQNKFYVRSGISPLPLTTTDFGIFYIATQPGSTFPTSSTIGELWITYDVVLLKPKISLARFGYGHWFGFGSSVSALYANPATVATSSVLYGTLASATLSQLSASTFSITLPSSNPGDVYQVIVTLIATTITGGSFSESSQISASPLNVLSATSAVKVSSIFNIANNNEAASVAFYTVTTASEPGLLPTIIYNVPSLTTQQTISADVIVNCVGNGYSLATI